MTDATYFELYAVLSELDYSFLLSTAPFEEEEEPDLVQAAIAWDGMNLMVSSLGRTMTEMNLQENFHDYDGYRPYFLNIEGEFEMQGNMSNYLVIR